jgi:hypothetical protein
MGAILPVTTFVNSPLSAVSALAQETIGFNSNPPNLNESPKVSKSPKGKQVSKINNDN